MNVHIRCKGNVAPNCGVNSVELANKLAEMGLQAGGLSKRNTIVKKKQKKTSVFCTGVKQVLHKHDFFKCMDLIFVWFLQVRGSEPSKMPSEKKESMASETQQQTLRMGISDFTFLQVLGKGSFGKVGIIGKENGECSMMITVVEEKQNGSGGG